jgi:hypothetical protein
MASNMDSIDMDSIDIDLADTDLADIGLVDISRAMKERYIFALLAKISNRTYPIFSNEKIATHVFKPSIKRYITHNA